MSNKSEPVIFVSPDELFEKEGFNVRLADDPDNIAHIAALADSIFAIGVQQPLTAYSDKNGGPSGQAMRYIVTDGHCRLAAVREAIARGAPIKAVPVRLEAKRANEADHTFSMVVRNQYKPLTSLELGIVCRRMLGFGWTEADLAAKSGYSLQHIRNVVVLAGAPSDITKLVETGQVSASLAIDAIQAEGDQAGETLAAAVAVAKAEDAAAPKRKAKGGKAKPGPVKATLKHVKKAKGLPPKASIGKKAPKQPEPSSMVDDDKLVRTLRDASAATALELFDGYGKRRIAVLAKLLDMPQHYGNGKPAALETLKLIFGRAIADEPSDENIVTVVMDANDWSDACELIGVELTSVEEAEAAE